MLALGLLLALLNTVSGVQLGGECWSSANGVAAGGCDQGTTCGPWAPNQEEWDNVSPWYCVAFPTLQAGATCDYANKVGPCANGLSCNSGKCSDPSSVPTTAGPTTAGPTTAGPTTTGPTTAGPTTAGPTTAAPVCTFEGREICMDTNNAAQFAGTCCKTPYTCDQASGSERTSICSGTDLDATKTCWSDNSSNGTCKAGLLCKTPSGEATGTCTTPPDDSTCVATGVMGSNLCYNAEVGQYIKNRNCCPDFNTDDPETGCFPDYTTAPQGDRYCMRKKVPKDEPCGWTAASNYAGMCDRSVTPKLECINGICAEPLTTTTGAPTTTTAAPECAGKGGLCYDSDTYNEYPCCNEAACPVPNDPYSSAYCTDAAGPVKCTADGGDDTGLAGTKCWDGSLATPAVVANVNCCYGACDQASGTVDGFCPAASAPAPATTTPAPTT